MPRFSFPLAADGVFGPVLETGIVNEMHGKSLRFSVTSRRAHGRDLRILVPNPPALAGIAEGAVTLSTNVDKHGAVSDTDPNQTARAQLVQALDRVSGGDAAALQFVYERTAAKLYGICLRICHERQAAEDVLQETYLKIWRSAGRFDPGRASPMTWLCAIARNSAIDWRRARGGPVTVGEDAALEIPDDSASAFDLLDAAGDRARIFACLETLDERQRGVIRAAFFDGLSYPELAEAMATPLGTIKSWVRRGLIKLKVCLGDG